MRRLHVGTSGYSYDHWRRIFYPEGLGPGRWLAFYASVFETLELNATFYRLATPAAVDAWRDAVPDGFVFAAKGSRYLTHMKRLTDTGRGVRRFFRPMLRLGDKLGPVLWQLPPQMKPDLPRLETFLRSLPEGLRHVVEFRDGAWHTERTCDLLDELGAALCEHDLVDVPAPRPTGGFRYLRFHGKTGKYRGRYGRAALARVARDLASWRRDAFVYFNNDTHGHAIRDALELKGLLAEASAARLGAPVKADTFPS
jgi:uncharacterized protein YecE (DUF72 family)